MRAYDEMTPRQIVAELDKYIVGQHEAKRAVAVAVRNRIRRERLPRDMAEEILPKNILMIGPTGVGKTEIARRLAKIYGAPFLKVEATKYTEVGYVGRDVESMIRELAETSVQMVRAEKMQGLEETAAERAIERIVDILQPLPRKRPAQLRAFVTSPSGTTQTPEGGSEEDQIGRARARLRERIKSGALDERPIEIETEETRYPMVEIFAASGMEEMGLQFQDMLSKMMPKRKRKRQVTIAEAKELLAQEEMDRMLDMDAIAKEALERAERMGIVFIDELDKIAGQEKGGGPDVSREGVQRDLLPIIEGSTVMTRYGALKTDHILFIGAGAFHTVKPSDMIPELQGRFPIRVELKNLTREDFVRILAEPENALTKQYKLLIETEGVKCEFTDEGIDEIARVAEQVNLSTENIGARRLHTILEKVVEDVLFDLPERREDVRVDKAMVDEKMSEIVKDRDLSRYIL